MLFLSNMSFNILSMRMSSLLTAFFLLFLCQLDAQVGFLNRNDLLREKDLHSAVPVGIADMNGDGLEDIISLNIGSTLFIQYQTPDSERPFVRYEVPVSVDNMEQNDLSIADFNNDGANDIIIVGSYDRVKVLYSIPNTYAFNLTYIVVNPFFSQGASTGDFNHDGWVDAVILNDNGANYTLLNDGTGTLVEQDLFDFVTVPPSDNSGNYGSVYTDFDMDGDLDFYIAKCRQGVNNPADPRRIDVLFVNDGEGNYIEDAARYGLADGHQTWTADFGDIDNDGDMDLFKTQHDVISELFENINNDTFINITPQTGLNIGGVPLQGMFRDFDNDGFQDILVSGDRVDFWRNNGDKTFTKQDPFTSVIFGTFALGDLNNDGFTDVYASRVIPFNNPDLLREDILFLNAKNDNHFLAITLKDETSNASAIGAMALLYGPWGIQVREVRGGEQYGVSNSHQMIFGLGAETVYDSLVIRWADGTRESFDNVAIDKASLLRRGGCQDVDLEMFPKLTILCNNDSLVLNVDDALADKLWSNGSTADSIIVKEPGLYYVTLKYIDECPSRTVPIEVTSDPDTIQPLIYFTGNPQLCHGENALLALPSGASYLWSTGETTQVIQATQTGEYFASVEGYCKQQQSDTIHLEFFTPELPVTTQDTFLPGESAILTATGDNIEWYADSLGTIFLGNGNSYQLDNLTDTVTIYAQNSTSIDGLDFQLGPVTQAGVNKYNAAFVNGGLLFEVYEPIILHQITVYTDSIGPRIIDINDGSSFFYEHQQDIGAGETNIDLEIELPIGSYTISTNTDLNNQVFGQNSPYLWRSSEGILYPFEIPGIMSITNSTFGSDFFYYFYDWKVSTLDKFCYSDFVPATAILDLGSATNESAFNDHSILLAPNPTDGLTTLTVKTSGALEIILTSMQGAVLLQKTNFSEENSDTLLDLTPYPSGIYFVRIIQQGKAYSRKIIRL